MTGGAAHRARGLKISREADHANRTKAGMGPVGNPGHSKSLVENIFAMASRADARIDDEINHDRASAAAAVVNVLPDLTTPLAETFQPVPGFASIRTAMPDRAGAPLRADMAQRTSAHGG